MKVFVTGASGYIGHAVSRALRRAGYDVYGLVRSAEKATAVARDEIHPVMGDIGKPDGWSEVAAECAVLVHTAADMQAGMVGPDATCVDAMLALGKRGAQPKTIVYTSGVWVHGDTRGKLVDETTPLRPISLVAWRPAHEQRVLNASGVRGLVLRPACVYGGRGGLTGYWFGPAAAGQVVHVVGDGRNAWTMIHVEDLADAYVRAIDSGLGGEVFDLSDRSRETAYAMAKAAARAANPDARVELVPLQEAAKTMGPFAECLALDQHIDARKAVRRLGWQPKHGGFSDGVDAYFAAWRAWNAK